MHISISGLRLPACNLNVWFCTHDRQAVLNCFWNEEAISFYSIVTLQLRQKQYNRFSETSISLRETVNLTLDYSSLTVSGARGAINSAAQLQYGFLLSATDETFVYAVKADQGTTDGYLIPVLTNYSREFFIAGWPWVLHKLLNFHFIQKRLLTWYNYKGHEDFGFELSMSYSISFVQLALVKLRTSSPVLV